MSYPDDAMVPTGNELHATVYTEPDTEHRWMMGQNQHQRDNRFADTERGRTITIKYGRF